MEGQVRREEERKRDKVEGEIKTWLERKQKEKRRNASNRRLKELERLCT